MFLLGCGVTLLTLSVAVSLTLLVPLVAKGYLRRANTLPYIAGANITTLADTLVAAVLLGNQDGARVVVAVTLAVTLWTVGSTGERKTSASQRRFVDSTEGGVWWHHG